MIGANAIVPAATLPDVHGITFHGWVNRMEGNDMAKKHNDAYDDYADEYGDDALEDLMELLEEFPELDEYIDEDMWDSFEDGDFYGPEHS